MSPLGAFVRLSLVFGFGDLVFTVPPWRSFRTRLAINEAMLQQGMRYDMASSECAVGSLPPLPALLSFLACALVFLYV